MNDIKVCGACAGGYHEACRTRHEPCACRATHLCGSSAQTIDEIRVEALTLLEASHLLMAVESCEARRLELLEEIRVNAERHRGAVRALVDAVGEGEAARLLGVSRQQVWRLARVR